MGKERFTTEQLWAAETRGGTVLVSAAAGSGKTTVLVERVLGILTDTRRPVSADRLLIVTFMRDAAAEMRERLNKALSERIEQEPDNLYLRRQKLLLQKAAIGTIHSFCSSCLREFFAAAGVAPDFRIAEPSEIKLIQNEALTALIDESYGEMSGDLQSLINTLSADRSSSALSSLISRTNAFISAYPDPEEKLQELSQIYSGESDPESSVWCQYLLSHCRDTISYLLRFIERTLNIISYSPEVEEKYAPVFESDAEQLEMLIDAARLGWSSARSAFFAVNFAVTPRISGDPQGKEEAKSARKCIKDTIEQLSAYFHLTDEDYAAESVHLSSAVKTLCELTLSYRKAVSARKAEKRILEFDDLEHMTADLLFKKTPQGYERTDIARELSHRYDEILLDEYQDTNYTQDLIFRAISREDGNIIGDGTNMFMVGDVKQSIYRFRKAVPKLFIDRLNRYTPFNPNSISFPAKITLGKNFRSRPEVTGAINFFFSQLMTPERGGVQYDSDEQRLFSGRAFPAAEGMQTELHIISGAKLAADDTRDLIEARYCARLINEMIDSGFTVTDGGNMRAAEYGDFCILRRSIKGGHGDAFISQLSSLGIPVAIASDSGFFSAPEVCVVMSLLRAVDNPLLDVPLLAALRSPIFGFDCDRLAMLRSNRSKGSLYADLLSAADSGQQDCINAVQTIARLRDMAAAMPSDRLISAIYRTTGYFAAVQAADNGAAQKANLLMLMDYAHSFEGSGFKGLSRFINMVDRLIEQGEDRPCATVSSSNCVTIRTMHKAKGLEFPVCIVAGLDSTAVHTYAADSAVFHNELGIGLNIYDQKRRIKYPSVQRQAIELAAISDDIDEELRVLYVALTRAVDKLIMLDTVSSASSLESRINSAAGLVFDYGIDKFALGQSPSCGKWLIACALRHPNGEQLREKSGREFIKPIETDVPLDIKIISADDVMLMPIETPDIIEQTEYAPDAELSQLIRERMSYSYPYRRLHDVPSKVTASGTHAGGLAHIAAARPSFMQEQGLSPTERGTALHKYMQFCDFSLAAVSPEKECVRLTAAGHLSANEAQAVDFGKVRAFFSSDMGELLKETISFEREWRFTAELEPRFLCYFTDADASGETVVLEGECDLLLYTNDGVAVVDYKTDRVSHASQLIDHYLPQLQLYASAVRQITESDNVRCYIYSFALSQLIALDV